MLPVHLKAASEPMCAPIWPDHPPLSFDGHFSVEGFIDSFQRCFSIFWMDERFPFRLCFPERAGLQAV